MPEGGMQNPGMMEAVAATYLAGFPTHCNGGINSSISVAGTSGIMDSSAFPLPETTEDIHLSAFHCVLQLVGSRVKAEQTPFVYFNLVNMWLDIIDQARLPSRSTTCGSCSQSRRSSVCLYCA